MCTKMTRRIAGSSQTNRTRTPNVLPIGHLSTKSSVYSPVSMSRMSQDLVCNHMKSHYQRIASAKACVDTSPPKSIKLTIKEKDRKRKQALLSSSIQGLSSKSNSRQTDFDEASNSPRQQEINNSINDHEEISHGYGLRNAGRPSSRESFKRHGNSSNKNGRHNTDVEDLHTNEDIIRCNTHIDQINYEPYQSMRQSTEMTRNPTTSYPRYHDKWRDSRNETLENGYKDNYHKRSGRVFTSTPRFDTQDDFAMNPNLTTTFSYKSLPSRTRPTKKSPEERIWMEEQKYLQFISDLTSDILARGICSNRVINKVFESHIANRKDDLDEENMREMLNQLKEDLGVSDD